MHRNRILDKVYVLQVEHKTYATWINERLEMIVEECRTISDHD